MADDKPTEDQIKSANEAEMQRWEGDFPEEDLQVKYKREEDQGEDSKSEVATEDEEEPEHVEYSDPEPVLTTQDPGEYKAADYSFDVTLKDGKTVTIKTPEDADKVAEDPDNFEKPKQLLDFINKATSMRNKLERDYEKWEDSKKTFETQSQTETQRVETVKTFTAEFDYLADKGLLPAIPRELKNADWQDPEVAKDPVVKQYNEILDYLLKENEVRAKAKIRPLTSIIDAFNAWTLETGKQAATESKKAAGEARKAAGSRVAGVSSSEQKGFVPKGIAVGRTGMFDRNQAVWDN